MFNYKVVFHLLTRVQKVIPTLAFLFILFCSQQVFSATNVSGTLSTNTAWDLAGSPYVLTGNTSIAPPDGNAQITLTVDSGVEIQLNGFTLQIGSWYSNNGYRSKSAKILADGARFVGAGTVVLYDGSGSNIGNSTFDNTNITLESHASGTFNNISTNKSINSNGGTWTLTGSQINGGGIASSGGTFNISGTTITAPVGEAIYGISLSNCSGNLATNTISGFTYPFYLAGGIHTLSGNIISGNTYQVIATGGASSVDSRFYYCGLPYKLVSSATIAPPNMLPQITLTVDSGVEIQLNGFTLQIGSWYSNNGYRSKSAKILADGARFVGAGTVLLYDGSGSNIGNSTFDNTNITLESHASGTFNNISTNKSINSNGGTWTLTGSQITGGSIASSGGTFNIYGATIIAPAGALHGISLSNCNGILSGNTISGFSYPFFLAGGMHTLSGNTISGNTFQAIATGGSVNITSRMQSWGLPYKLVSSSTIVPPENYSGLSVTLRIDPGVEVQLNGNTLQFGSEFHTGVHWDLPAKLEADGVTFTGVGTVYFYDGGGNNISNCTFNNAALTLGSLASGSLSNTTMINNGITKNGGTWTIYGCNNFQGTPTVFGIRNNTTATLSAINDFWGSATGPTYILNPLGKGVSVSNFIDYSNYATSRFNAISGRYLDSASKLPIAGAIITLSNGMTTQTDTTGYYRFSCLGRGVFTICASDNTHQKSCQGVSISSTDAVVNFNSDSDISFPITFAPYYPISDTEASTVMQGGKIFRWYRISDTSNNPLAFKSFIYRYNGGGEVFNTTTDDQGFAQIESGWALSSQRLILEVLKPDLSVKQDVQNSPAFDVITTDRDFTQEWSLLIGGKVSAGLGGPGIKIGPVKAELAKVGVGFKGSRTFGVSYERLNGADSVVMANTLGGELFVEASAGLFGNLWGTSSRPQLEIGFGTDASISGRYGTSVKFNWFFDQARLDHDRQLLAAAGYFLETSTAALPSSPVGFSKILRHVIDKITGVETYYNGKTFDIGSSISANAGASANFSNPFHFLPGSGVSISLAEASGELATNFSMEDKTSGGGSMELAMTGSYDLSFLKTEITQKFGGDKRKKDTPQFTSPELFNLFSVSREGTRAIKVDLSSNNHVEQLTLKQTIDMDRGDFGTFILGGETLNTRETIIEVRNTDNLQRLYSSGSYISLLTPGNVLYFSDNSYFKWTKEVVEGLSALEDFRVQKDEQKMLSLDFDVELSLGFKLGLGLQIEYFESTRFDEIRGKLSSTRGVLTTEKYQKDAEVTANRKSVEDFTNLFKVALKDALSDLIDSVTGSIVDGIQNTAAKVKGTWDGFIAGVSKLVPTTSSSKMVALMSPLDHAADKAIAKSSDYIPNDANATALGDVYIVNLQTPDGTPVTDFSSNPLTLSIDYTDELLAGAGIDLAKATKLALYRWDGKLGCYIYQPSQVDTAAKKVTASIMKPGQYVIGIDEVPPAISPLKVSDGTPTPTITATVKDSLSGIDLNTFMLTLDGSAVVTGANLSSYFDPTSGLFTYMVPTPLTPGSHTASISVKDSAGNVGASQPFSFTVNNTLPVISHSPVSLAPAGTNVQILATVTDDTGVRKAQLLYRPDQSEAPYTSIDMTPDGTGGYSGTIPAYYVTALGVRYYIRATDIDGNINQTLPNIITATGNTSLDTTIVVTPSAITKETNATFTFTASGVGASFQCKLDVSDFSECYTPQVYQNLAEGSHSFQVKAIDVSGTADPTPAAYTWTVDTTPPTISITPVATPTSTTTQTIAGTIEAGATVTVTCPTAATGPSVYPTSTSWNVAISSLKPGDNIITATATDAAGNTAHASTTIVMTATAKPGDCDGSGSITIAEVQGAINMYLGLKAPAVCVDINNDGVSIDEVQKVINGYLGL